MKTKLNLSQALPLAEKIKDALSPACERIEIAGSIRRRKSTVGDIEIVAIPKLIPDMEAQLSLFDDPPKLVSALDMLLERLIRDKGNFRRGNKNGDYMKNFLLEYDNEDGDIPIELYITSGDQWGYIYALRTGPGEFNQAWVTQQRKGGLLPNRYSFSGGWLYKDGKPIPTPEEEDVFALIGGGVISPTDRDQWRKYYF